MHASFGLNLGLGGVPLLSDAETRFNSVENPTGPDLPPIHQRYAR